MASSAGGRAERRRTAFTRRLNRLTQEVSQSRQRSEQLQAALEKRTRRVQQLIGDRDRLTSLLVATPNCSE